MPITSKIFQRLLRFLYMTSFRHKCSFAPTLHFRPRRSLATVGFRTGSGLGLELVLNNYSSTFFVVLLSDVRDTIQGQNCTSAIELLWKFFK